MPTVEPLILCGAITLASELLFYRLSRRDPSGHPLGSDLECEERKLAVASVFVHALFLISILTKAASYFGWIPDDVRRHYLPLLGIPFLIACLHYLKARWYVWRAGKPKLG